MVSPYLQSNLPSIPNIILLHVVNGITDLYLRLAMISAISSCLIPFFLFLNLVWIMIQHFLLNGFRVTPVARYETEVLFARNHKYQASLSSYPTTSPNLDKSPTSASTLWTPQWPQSTRPISIDTNIDLEKAMNNIQGTGCKASPCFAWEDVYRVPGLLKCEDSSGC
jgi:hypothetical protein